MSSNTEQEDISVLRSTHNPVVVETIWKRCMSSPLDYKLVMDEYVRGPDWIFDIIKTMPIHQNAIQHMMLTVASYGRLDRFKTLDSMLTDRSNDHIQSAMRRACCSGHIDIVKYICNHYRKHLKSPCASSALANCNVQICEYLQGCDWKWDWAFMIKSVVTHWAKTYRQVCGEEDLPNGILSKKRCTDVVNYFYKNKITKQDLFVEIVGARISKDVRDFIDSIPYSGPQVDWTVVFDRNYHNDNKHFMWSFEPVLFLLKKGCTYRSFLLDKIVDEYDDYTPRHIRDIESLIDYLIEKGHTTWDTIAKKTKKDGPLYDLASRFAKRRRVV
jgi:hypothetical protein